MRGDKEEHNLRQQHWASYCGDSCPSINALETLYTHALSRLNSLSGANRERSPTMTSANDQDYANACMLPMLQSLGSKLIVNHRNILILGLIAGN